MPPSSEKRYSAKEILHAMCEWYFSQPAVSVAGLIDYMERWFQERERRNVKG